MQLDILTEIEKQKVSILHFIPMGGKYEAQYPDDVCNHRIRTEIVNPKGRHFFIELGKHLDGNIRFDFVVDRDMEKEYAVQRYNAYMAILTAGGFHLLSKESELIKRYRFYQQQPYYWFKKEQCRELILPYTISNCLKVVNELFECNFTEFLLETKDHNQPSISF